MIMYKCECELRKLGGELWRGAEFSISEVGGLTLGI